MKITVLRALMVFFVCTAINTNTPNIFASTINDPPVGEVANYKLDKNRRRTSSMIKKGKFRAEVLNFDANAETGSAFNLKINYDVSIIFVGRKEGEREVEIPEEFFGPDFIERIREEGEVVYSQFKVKHLGYEDATNMDGASYPSCDKLFFYDIQTSQAGFMDVFIRIFSATEKAPTADIEDLKITTWVAEGIPVAGAVKADITGKTRGRSVKIGVDYTTETTAD